MNRPRYDTALPLSGERFTARYRIAAETPAAAEEAARALSVEQTIEFPAELVEGTIAREVVARVESLEETAPGVYAAELSFAVELVGGELTQLLNVFFGNSSLLPNVRLERIGLSPGLARRFPGPRYGSRGLRRVLDVPAGPLLSTA
ncbi:MAG TPA: ribulose 1,5-bisphosphate carboxylase large subunit, partial [Oceanithermus profundus]|nr:ribulose 1,5-bisphosphate carboxylase large subunit [Oceanithermus profundus]